MKNPFPKEETRQALLEALPATDQAASAPQQAAQFTYVPPSHALALDPANPIVVGIRGAGKSFWWAALNSESHRRFIASAFPKAKIDNTIIPSQGFGSTPSPAMYPGKDTIAGLAKEVEARHIWRAIIATHLKLSAPYPQQDPQQSIIWQERVRWGKEHPEELDQLIYMKNEEFVQQNKVRLILFDALDRLADNWSAIRPLARSLFQVALDFRGYRNIRLKIFVRPDMLEDRDILAFPDSSKLLAGKIELVWYRADFYALVFQCLGNAEPGGNKFRDHCHNAFGLQWNRAADNIAWVLPGNLRTDEGLQKEVFHAITGPAMAKGASGHKRGYPYTWLPNHLMDGRNQVSPRSFCAALRCASQQDALKDWEYPLDYKAIQTGVQKASSIRVDEIHEDYPWIEKVMSPLRNKITVPCPENDIITLWNGEGVIDKLRSGIEAGDVVKLPPQHINEGASGVLKDLETLGVIQFLSKGRIQMPDVYRIAFSLGRKGGVKPLR